MTNRIAAVCILFAVLLLAAPPAPARADIAPPPIPMVGGLGALEYQSTQVEMRAERVEMEIMPYRIEDAGEVFYHRAVTVNAWFTMHNASSQDEMMQVAFPLDDMNRHHYYTGGIASYTYLDFTPGTFEAQVNGAPVETTILHTKFPCHPNQYCDDQMRWAGFNVTFPAGEEVLIRVSYRIDNGSGGEALFNVGYTLETGAAWKGPIGEAVIVFRFPHPVEDFIMPETTPGYQVMQNEIYWRYENFEPEYKDNISVAFIDPNLWTEIRDARHRVKVNPKDDAAWAQLGDAYSYISHFHGPNIRSKDYDQRAYETYRKGLEANPDSAALNAGYADLYFTDCCYYGPVEGVSMDADMKFIQPYVEKALKYDPGNEKALYLLNALHEQNMGSEITLGPTLTPTITATPTATRTLTRTPAPEFPEVPSQTLPPTYTPRPTKTSYPTRTLTATPLPTSTQAATVVSAAVQPANPPSGPSGALMAGGGVLAAGLILVAFLLGRMTGRQKPL